MRFAIYWQVWPLVAFGGCAASFTTLCTANALNLRFLPDDVALMLNLAPAMIAGALAYGWITRRVITRSGVPRTLASHVRRTWPLYFAGAILVVWMARGWEDKGFGLVAQLFVWPLAATVGGLIGDVAAALLSSPRASTTAT